MNITYLKSRDQAPIVDRYAGGDMTPDRARGIKKLFDGVTAAQERHGVKANAPGQVELGLLALAEAVLVQEAVMEQASQFYKDHEKLSDTVEIRQETVELLTEGRANSERSELLNRWRVLKDQNARRLAGIMSENAVNAFERRDEAREEYKSNQTVAHAHFRANEEIYKETAVADAESHGVDINYPLYT